MLTRKQNYNAGNNFKWISNHNKCKWIINHLSKDRFFLTRQTLKLNFWLDTKINRCENPIKCQIHKGNVWGPVHCLWAHTHSRISWELDNGGIMDLWSAALVKVVLTAQAFLTQENGLNCSPWRAWCTWCRLPPSSCLLTRIEVLVSCFNRCVKRGLLHGEDLYNQMLLGQDVLLYQLWAMQKRGDGRGGDRLETETRDTCVHAHTHTHTGSGSSPEDHLKCLRTLSSRPLRSSTGAPMMAWMTLKNPKKVPPEPG